MDYVAKKSISNKMNISSQKTTVGTVFTARDKTERSESRISNKITKSFLEREKSYLKDPKDYEKIIEESNSYEMSDSLKDELEEGRRKSEIRLEQPIKLNIEIPDKEGTVIKSITVNITNKVCVMDLLQQSINIFNDLFYREGILYELNSDISKYSIKPSKKSGKPDNDLPKINLKNLVYETNLTSFSIIYDRKDLTNCKKSRNFFEKCKHCIVW